MNHIHSNTRKHITIGLITTMLLYIYIYTHQRLKTIGFIITILVYCEHNIKDGKGFLLSIGCQRRAIPSSTIGNPYSPVQWLCSPGFDSPKDESHAIWEWFLDVDGTHVS